MSENLHTKVFGPGSNPEFLGPKTPHSPEEQQRMLDQIRDAMMKPKPDMVNHPPHYTKGKIEVIDFLIDQDLPGCVWNVVKYICRYRHKGSPVEDLKKARWYLDKQIQIEEAKQNGSSTASS